MAARQSAGRDTETEAHAETPVFHQIADLIGMGPAAAMSRRFGGRRLHIPKDPPVNHEISVVIGPVNAKFLGARFGGERVDIPMSFGRREEVVRLLAEGWTPARIAASVPCTERWVYEIRRELKDEGEEQPDLFSRAG